MNLTNRATRFAGFTLAVLATLAIQVSLLSSFNSVAQEASLAQACPTPAVANLQQAGLLADHS